MKNTNLVIVGIVVLLVLAGGGYYLMSMQKPATPGATLQQDEKKMAPPITEGGEETSEGTEMTTEEGNEKTFTVTASNYVYDVTEMKVNVGDTVTIVFKNSEGTHDWKVDEFTASTKVIPAGAEETITFVADKAGTFEYYCSVGKHRANGMVGKLIVE